MFQIVSTLRNGTFFPGWIEESVQIINRLGGECAKPCRTRLSRGVERSIRPVKLSDCCTKEDRFLPD